MDDKHDCTSALGCAKGILTALHVHTRKGGASCPIRSNAMNYLCRDGGDEEFQMWT